MKPKESDVGLSRTQRRWLDIASKAAENSTCRSKHGAVLVSGGRILSIGVNRSRLMNSYRTWWQPGPPPSIHAEAAAIKQCRNIDLSNAVLYISRVNRSGDEMYSRPCPKCQNDIIEAGIKKVVYTYGNGKFKEWP